MDVNAAVGHVDERLPGICGTLERGWKFGGEEPYHNIKLNDTPKCSYIHVYTLSSWCLNQPISQIKYAQVKLDHFPRDRGENQKCLKPTPSYCI